MRASRQTTPPGAPMIAAAKETAMFERKLKSAKAVLADATQPVVDRTRETAAVADDYVSTNPWTAVGVAMAAGALLGFWAARR
jgi:ElaB/YqjD/DUF883 family membrane-anchored ribosome-binding protein